MADFKTIDVHPRGQALVNIDQVAYVQPIEGSGCRIMFHGGTCLEVPGDLWEVEQQLTSEDD